MINVKNIKLVSIHGDLNYTNIIIDGKGMIKIIDPKGRFGDKEGIFGDVVYDLAKLRQCYNSFYIELLNHRYQKCKKGEIFIYMSKYHRFCSLMDRLIERRFNVDILDVQIVETLQLLSMISLHNEDEHFQNSIFIVAINMMKKCICGDTNPLESRIKV